MKLTSTFIIAGALLVSTTSYLQAIHEEKMSPLESHVVDLANHHSEHTEQARKVAEQMLRKNSCNPITDPRCK